MKNIKSLDGLIRGMHPISKLNKQIDGLDKITPNHWIKQSSGLSLQQAVLKSWGQLSRELDSKNFSRLDTYTKSIPIESKINNLSTAFGTSLTEMSAKHQSAFLHMQNQQKSFLGLNAYTKSVARESHINTLSTAFGKIQSIEKQHKHFFDNRISLLEISEKQQAAFSQMKNLQFALSGVSLQMATLAATQKNWSLLDDFENINEQVIEITNNLSDEIEFTEEQTKQFKKLIETITSFLHRNKQLGVNSLIAIDIILRIAGFHQYYDFLKTKPELATKEYIVKFNTKIIQEVAAQLKEIKEYRATNRVCMVMLKPRDKTMLIEKLPKDFEIVVLQVHHKWIYVSYFSPIDNLPQTGWILKKYLDKPE